MAVSAMSVPEGSRYRSSTGSPTATSPDSTIRASIPRLPSTSARRPSRNSSMRWHGSQTIVISNTASSPTRTCWPIGHCCTSVPSTVRFSRIAPGSTPTDSRCSSETNSTSRLGGFAWAQPSRPSPTIARRRSCPTERPLFRPGDVQMPVILAIAAILPTAPAAPALVRRPATLLDVPVLPEVEAAPIRRELQQQAAGKRDLTFLGVLHRRPPLHRDHVPLHDRLPHSHLDTPLGTGSALPVGADPLVPETRLAERRRTVRRVLGEEGQHQLGIVVLPRSSVALDPVSQLHVTSAIRRVRSSRPSPRSATPPTRSAGWSHVWRTPRRRPPAVPPAPSRARSARATAQPPRAAARRARAAPPRPPPRTPRAAPGRSSPSS